MDARRALRELNGADEFGGLDDAQFDGQFDGKFREEFESQFEDGRATETWRLLAEQLAPRIDELSHVCERLQAAPYYVWLADSVHLCDPAGELRVKVEALQWMFRIAKHLNGAAREMVMETVSRSVDEMEVAVEAQLRAAGATKAAA